MQCDITDILARDEVKYGHLNRRQYPDYRVQKAVDMAMTNAVSMSAAIKQYISTKYDQHPDMFKIDLEAIDTLRTSAVYSLEAHVSGVQKLTLYAAQLVWIGGKFPIDVRTPSGQDSSQAQIGVDFTWYPALGFNTQRPESQNNLRYELANVLYNLASLYTQLAVSLNRSTSDGLKSACNYFCQAAGVISHLKETVIPELRTMPPEDMDTVTLESLQQLLLAQAQECFWSKAVKDGLKDGLIAKLAAKVSDFYDQAAEYGTMSDIISTEWIHHMTAKHHHFAAAAQYRASRDCLDRQKYGEEVARLRDSLVCVNEALKESRWINKIVLGDLNGLKARVNEDLKRAEKDNDVIYLMSVPPKSELKSLDRAGMATPRIPQEVSDPYSALGDKGAFGQPLFARLVPYAVHVAVSIYDERKERLVNNTIIDELEALTTKLRDLLQSLNLPASLQAIEKPLGLPPSLTTHAEEIRQQDGLHKLQRAMHEIRKLKANDEAMYQEGVGLLKIEAADDDKARSKHGTARWTRQPSPQAAEKLYAQVNEIDGYLKSAASSDELVRNKFKDCESVIQILSSTKMDLDASVPSSKRATLTPAVEKAADNLRSALNDVSHLERRRKRIMHEMREKVKNDDINSAILAETARFEREYPMQKIEPAMFENLFEDRLEQYEKIRRVVSEEKESQPQLVVRIQEANAAFVTARRGDSSTKEREQALQRLENAYFKYKEIVSNLNTGRKFYNDLATIVTRFTDECRDFAYHRRVEAGQMETDLSTALSNLSLNLQDQKERQSLRSHYAPQQQPPPHSNAPITAPTPTRAPQPEPGIWNPTQGIKFGGTPPQQPQQVSSNVHHPTYPNASARGGQWDVSRGVQFG
ncbi:MAG: hypothetical protein LQ348_004828 [Seirophora lacunosa]|nr:MAG: hypothetical protein LQ348_004828 [Seirophora lacunosa]